MSKVAPKKKISKRVSKKRVAIFDIDGTIFRSSLLIEITEALIEAGFFPKKAREEYSAAHKKWLDREGTYEDYIMAVVSSYAKHIKGVHYSDFVRVAENVLAFHRNRVYRYTRDLVKKLKNKGYYLLAISLSPKGIADLFAKGMGFNKVYGLRYDVDDSGRYTGETSEKDIIKSKALILIRAMEKENLTLAGSFGVGDTQGDIAFLERVRFPICFNPNKELYEHARKMGWKIIVERKDVIYEIK